MNSRQSTETFVGIDVSKDTLDVFILGKDKTLQVPNDSHGFKELCQALKKHPPNIVVLEGTGGLEKCAASWMALEGLPVAVVNPRQVRRYAQAHNILAKTDRIDAKVLAHFAKDVAPEARFVVDQERERLRALHTRRLQLINERTRQTNQRSRVYVEELLSSYDAIIQALDNELKDVETRIHQAIGASLEWHQKTELLKTMKGIGDESARTLIAHLPELGQMDRRQIASLAGLAPYSNDSGQHRGRRSIKGGRGQVRKTLYMATLSAVQYNQVIGDYYSRLRANGKYEKVARVACMRKMLTILNAMIKNNTAFNAYTTTCAA
jgi:transposase